jgi:hypothetical protein
MSSNAEMSQCHHQVLLLLVVPHARIFELHPFHNNIQIPLTLGGFSTQSANTTHNSQVHDIGSIFQLPNSSWNPGGLQDQKLTELITNHSHVFFHDVLCDGRRKWDRTPYAWDMNKYRQIGVDISIAERVRIHALAETIENERFMAHHSAVRDSGKDDRPQT